MKGCSVLLMLSAIVLCAWASGSPLQAQSRTPERDRAALVALENEWLANEHNAAALERILASDFVHPLPTGDFITKAQHIAFSSRIRRRRTGSSTSINCECASMATSALSLALS